MRGCGRRLTDFADYIYRLVLRFVIGPRLHLGKEAERHQLEAGGDQQNAEEQ